MKSIILPLVLCGGLAAFLSVAATPSIPAKVLRANEPTADDMARARAILHAWENESPEKATRSMHVVYWTPADRDPQPAYHERLTRVMQHIQDFYKKEMISWGFGERSIQLDLDAKGLVNIHIAKGTLKSAECSESDSSDGQAIRRDSLAVLKEKGIDGDKETMVIFCNLADWDPVKRTMSHHSPYYASGTHRKGTAWQLDSPLLDPQLLHIKDQHLQDGQYGRISLGKYNSIFVGGVCHEIGHALGLPHCRECKPDRDDRGTALMGSGNRTYGEELRGESKGSFLTLGHTLKLVAHPQFSGSIKQIDTPATVTFKDVQLQPNADGLFVQGTATANLPMHAIIAYGDPEGGADYDSQIAAAIPQADGKFKLTLPKPDKRNCALSLNLVAVCANGAATAGVWSSQAYTLKCRVDGNFQYDVTKAQESLALAANVEAFRQGTLGEAELKSLPPAVQEIFRRLKLPDSSVGKPSPAEASAEIKSLALSDAAPVSAFTGWAGVHYDRTPQNEPLVGAQGPIPHGLYAHADSEFVYSLQGKWDSLSGHATLLEKGYGPVEAIILGDDKTLWETPEIKAGDQKSFSINVKGVQKLKLILKGKKGNGGAWGAWGEPLLKRG